MTRLLVEIDGEAIPLADCNWVRYSPAGCAYSSVWAGASTATAELAHREFVPLKRVRDREIRQGWTVRLLTPKQWQEQAKPCFYGDCEHRKASAS